MLGIPNLGSLRPQAVRLHSKCRTGLRPCDARFQPRNRFPAIIARRILRGFPEIGVARIVEPGRRHADNSQRHPINTKSGPHSPLVACKKLLPESIADYRDSAVSGRIVTVPEPSSRHRLRAEKREEIPGGIGNMSPHWILHFPNVDVELLDERGIGEIRALLPPFMKFFRA